MSINLWLDNKYILFYSDLRKSGIIKFENGWKEIKQYTEWNNPDTRQMLSVHYCIYIKNFSNLDM